MSNKNVQTVVVSAGKFSLTRKIAEFFKLGDDGKLDSFFSRITKKLQTQVTAHERNLSNAQFNHDQELEVLGDKLTDAKDALTDAFLKVEIERITSNADQDSFGEVYLSNIAAHEAAVERIEKQIESKKESFKDSQESTQKVIDALNKRINSISQE